MVHQLPTKRRVAKNRRRRSASGTKLAAMVAGGTVLVGIVAGLAFWGLTSLGHAPVNSPVAASPPVAEGGVVLAPVAGIAGDGRSAAQPVPIKSEAESEPPAMANETEETEEAIGRRILADAKLLLPILQRIQNEKDAERELPAINKVSLRLNRNHKRLKALEDTGVPLTPSQEHVLGPLSHEVLREHFKIQAEKERIDKNMIARSILLTSELITATLAINSAHFSLHPVNAKHSREFAAQIRRRDASRGKPFQPAKPPAGTSPTPPSVPSGPEELRKTAQAAYEEHLESLREKYGRDVVVVIRLHGPGVENMRDHWQQVIRLVPDQRTCNSRQMPEDEDGTQLGIIMVAPVKNLKELARKIKFGKVGTISLDEMTIDVQCDK